MGVKKLQQNVFRFTSVLLNTAFLFILFLIFFAYMVSKDTGFSFLGVIIMLIFFYIFFIWFRVEKQGIILDLDKRVIKLKPNYFTALFKPFGKLSQNVINLDEIISASLNFDAHVDKNNKPSISYGVNLTGTFGSKNLDFMTRETAQSLYAMIASACNFDTMY